MSFIDDIMKRMHRRKLDDTSELFNRLDFHQVFRRMYSMYDPEELIIKFGGRERLMRLYYDAEIYASVDKRIAALQTTNLTWDESASKDVADFISAQITPFEHQLKSDFWWAIPYGYGVEQIIYKEDRSGEVEGFQREEFWRFEPLPDLIHIRLINSNLYNKSQEVLPYGKWILSTHEATAYKPIGEAMFSRLYIPYLFRNSDWDLWMRFMERYASGFLLGKTPNKADVTALLGVLEKATKGSAIAVTSKEDISMIQTSRDASGFSAIDDKIISTYNRVILGETQTSQMQERGGSASADVHDGIRREKTLSDIYHVEKSFNEAAIQICLVNGIDKKYAPKANLMWEQGLERARAERDNILSGTNVAFTRQYYERNYGLKEDEFEIVEKKEDFNPFGFTKDKKKSSFLTSDESESYVGKNTCACCGGQRRFKFAKGDKEYNQREDVISFMNRNGSEPVAFNLLVGAIQSAKSPKDLEKNLLALMDEDDPGFIDLMTNSLYYSAALGARAGNPQKIVEEMVNKSQVTIEHAVNILKDRVAVKSYYYDKLPKDLRAMSFYVSDLEKLRQVEMVQRSLANAIDQGNSFAQWRDSLDTEILAQLSDSRLETVYRNNVNTVYNQSLRYNAGTSDVTPYLMYTAIIDSATRASHAALDGTIKKATSSFWDKFTPPIAHRCRCGVIALDEETANEMGISTAGVSSFPQPEAGFGDTDDKTYGNVLGASKAAAQHAINALPKTSPFRTKFKDSIANIDRKVAIWWETEKNKF